MDLQLIADFENIYVATWNKYASSRGKGPATGKAFEKWIVDKLKIAGKNVQKGKMTFHFGEFQVDAAIPSLANPTTILEIKIYTDIQHSLMLAGLIRQLVNPQTKIGLVTFYRPGTYYGVKTSAITNILNNLKANFPKKFDYFHVQNGWSKAIARLVNFC
jgi:hypothetical protein